MLVKLLALSTMKTCTVKHSEEMGENFFEISFYQRKEPSFSFILPTVNHISEVSLQDILGKLPRPLLRGGTARVTCCFIFPVDL